MDNIRETLDAALATIRPLLAQGGKYIHLEAADEKAVTFRLEGFCSGCECGTSYQEGIRDLVQEKYPEIEVNFVV